MKNKLPSHQAGINLLEVLIAVLILSVGLLGLAGLQVASLKATQNASSKQQVAFLLDNMLERIRNNPLAINRYISQSPLNNQCNSAPTRCGGSQVCTNEQLATYDLYQMQCGDNPGSGVIGAGLVNLLPQGIIDVTCISNCDRSDANAPVHIRIQINWSERVSVSFSTDRDDTAIAAMADATPEQMVLEAIIDNPSARSGT